MNTRRAGPEIAEASSFRDVACVSALQRRVTQGLNRAFAGDDRMVNADLDARLLVGHVLGLDATGLIHHAKRPVSEAEVARALALAERRVGRGAGGADRRREGILEPAVSSVARYAGAASGYGDGSRGGARLGQARGPGLAIP